MSDFVNDISRARSFGKLPERFRAADVKEACPGRAENTYRSFLPKHRVGNSRGYTEYFRRHEDGSYSLIA